MELTMYQVDAFTEKLFGGNPAAVIPLEAWIDEGLMQKIALENNLAETVFFVKNEKNTYRIISDYITSSICSRISFIAT